MWGEERRRKNTQLKQASICAHTHVKSTATFCGSRNGVFLRSHGVFISPTWDIKSKRLSKWLQAIRYLCTVVWQRKARCTQCHSWAMWWLMARAGYQDSSMQSGPQSCRAANMTTLSAGIPHSRICQDNVKKQQQLKHEPALNIRLMCGSQQRPLDYHMAEINCVV